MNSLHVKNEYLLDIPIEEQENSIKWFDIEDIGGLSLEAFKIIKNNNLSGYGLDLACGTGYFSFIVTESTNLVLDGVDINRPFIERAIKYSIDNNIKCNFKHININNLLMDKNSKKYDFVSSLSPGYAFDTNNHIEILKKLRSITKNEGFYMYGWISPKEINQKEILKIKKYIISISDKVKYLYYKDLDYSSEDLLMSNKEKLSEEWRYWKEKRDEDINKIKTNIFTEVIFLIKFK